MHSWSDFVRSVVSKYERGESNQEISAEYGGQSVSWEGRISAMKLDEEFAPGVEMEMPDPSVKLNARKVVADHLFLKVPDEAKEPWTARSAGEQTRFRAKISKGAGPFPAIQVTAADDVYLVMVGVDSAFPEG